jgi:hypothetical protein
VQFLTIILAWHVLSAAVVMTFPWSPRLPTTCLLVALAACGEAAEPRTDAEAPGPSSDASSDGSKPLLDAGHAELDAATPDAAPEVCDPPSLPARAAVSAGGRVRLPAIVDGAALAIEAPSGWVVITTGTTAQVRLPYGVEGAHTLSVTRACAGARSTSVEVVVDVRPLRFVALPAWTEAEGPSAREHPLMMIHPRQPDRLYMYGGLAFRPRQFTLVSDLWSYNLVTRAWTAHTSSAAPARASGRWVALPGEGVAALMLGGANARLQAELGADRLDVVGSTSTWTRLPLTRGVGALDTQLGSLIHDAPRDRYLSVCGVADDVHCQIAEYDLSHGTFEVLTPTEGPAPSGRYGFFTAHDVENHRLVVFSGAGVPTLNNPVNATGDTWALELDEEPLRWEKLVDTSTSVPGRRNGCSAYDPVGQRLFVWGGTANARTTVPGLFVLDLIAGHARMREVPIELAKPARSSCAAVYDAARQRILFGFGNTTGAVFSDLVALEL